MIKSSFVMNNKCKVCIHFGFCKMYWGKECKRQGGKRIPRLKNSKLTVINKSSKKNGANPINKIQKLYMEAFEPINTKRANW